MIPKAKVKEIVSKHSTLEKELSSGNIDSKNYQWRVIMGIGKSGENIDKNKKNLIKLFPKNKKFSTEVLIN